MRKRAQKKREKESVEIKSLALTCLSFWVAHYVFIYTIGIMKILYLATPLICCHISIHVHIYKYTYDVLK